jgi:hypothetical protein
MVWGSGGIGPPLGEGKLSTSRLCRFNPSTHWIGGWVGSKLSLDAVAPVRNRIPVVQPADRCHRDWAIQAIPHRATRLKLSPPCCGYETWPFVLSVFENGVLERLFWGKKGKWQDNDIKLRDKKRHNTCSSRILLWWPHQGCWAGCDM